MPGKNKARTKPLVHKLLIIDIPVYATDIHRGRLMYRELHHHSTLRLEIPNYSVFTSSAFTNDTAKWRFYQEIATQNNFEK